MARIWLLCTTCATCLLGSAGPANSQASERPRAVPSQVLTTPVTPAPQPQILTTPVQHAPQQQLRAIDLSQIRPPSLTIGDIPPPVAGQPLLVPYQLTNPGPVAVTGTMSGRLGGIIMTDADGNAPSPITLAPGTTQSGSLRLVPNAAGGGTIQISFTHEGECNDRPGPYGKPVRICDNRRLAFVSQELEITAPPPPQPASPTYEEIAAHWAPLLSHDVDTNWGDRFWGDYITTANFDGDWNSSNNWDNLPNHPLPAKVYYWVNETTTHWYLGYAFFHPRDWSNANVADNAGAHNNDIEAVALAIERSPNRRFGRFLALVTVAHSDFYSYTDSDTPTGSDWFDEVSASRNVAESDDEDIDGDVDFVADDHGLHPIVYVEAEGHGVYGEPRSGYGVSDWAPLNRYAITDWRDGSWAGIVIPPKSGQPGVPEDRDGWGDGIIFHFEDSADVPTADRDDPPTHFEVVGYALEEVSSLWSRRNCPDTFNSDGQFPGGANPPWHLNDGNDNVSEDGVIFDRPGILFASYFKGAVIGPRDPDYTGRSFTLATGDCRD